MGNLKILGLPDQLALPGSVVVATSQASASMADDNLVTEEPSEFWRSSTNRPGDTIMYGYRGDAVDAYKTGGLALVAHNLNAASAKIRFLTENGYVDPATFYEDIVPDALTGATNTTAVIADVNEGFTPDGTWATPTVIGTPMVLEATFPTPSGSNPRAGAHMQSIWVYARYQGTAITGVGVAPKLSIVVNDGVTLIEIQSKAITSATGQWVYMSWDAADLSTANGSGVNVLITSQPNGLGAYVEVDTFAWRCEKANSPLASFTYDSGWLSPGSLFEMPDDPNSLIQLPASLSPYSSSAVFPATAQSVSHAYCMIYEDHSPDLITYDRNTFPAAADGYVEAGKFVCGTCFSPENNFSWGDFFGVEDLSSQQLTDGGQEFGSRRVNRRLARIPLDLLSTSESHFLMDRWVRRKGVLSPVLISLIPDEDEAEESATTFYATLRRVENWMGAQPAEGMGRSIVLEVEEKN